MFKGDITFKTFESETPCTMDIIGFISNLVQEAIVELWKCFCSYHILEKD